MAFVNDPNDPSGAGMFSKPGRFTTEKYIVFQKKDEILANQRKFLKVTSILNLNFDPLKEDDKHDEIETPKVTVSSTPRIRPQISPMTVGLSRDYVAKVKNKKSAGINGHYNPKFTYLDPNDKVLFEYKKETPKERPLLGPSRAEFPGDDSGKIKKKVFGSIDLTKQTPRNYSFYPRDDGTGGDRFTIIPEPPSSSRNRRVPSISISKYPGREKQNKFYKEEVYAPDYDPNWEYGRKRTTNLVVSFGMMSPRKPLQSKGLNIETQYDADIKRHIRTPRMEKYTPRETNPNLPLPSFMQKPITSRSALEQLNQKILEINANGDSKFFNSSKGFGTTTLNTARSTFQSPKATVENFNIIETTY